MAGPSKEVRFWCAHSLAEMGDERAIETPKELAAKDQRVVRGFWFVSKEAKWAIRTIRTAVKDRRRKKRKRGCLFCARETGGMG